MSITIQTDQGPLALPEGATLATALDQILSPLGKDPACVASAVNGRFVAKGERAEHLLQDGDTVLCFAPITGG